MQLTHFVLCGIFIGVAACGGLEDSPRETTTPLLAIEPTGPLEPTEPIGRDPIAIMFTCSGASALAAGGFLGNPDGVSCVPNSKWNGDIDAGFDMSGADYGAFISCLSGCFFPGMGFKGSDACLEKLRSCQEHLIGGTAAGGLTLKIHNTPTSSSAWASMGRGL